MSEIISKERVPYRIWDKVNSVWNELKFKTNAKSVDANDGVNLESKVGAINGITSDMTCEDESIAISAKAVNDSLGGVNFITEEGKGITGYTLTGADTVFPFSSFKYGTFNVTSYTETQSINCGFKPKSVIVICNTTYNMIAYKSDTIDRIDVGGSLNKTPSGITLTNTGFDFCGHENTGDNWWNGKIVYYLAFGSDAVMG